MKIVGFKINQNYKEGMDSAELYEVTRGKWTASLESLKDVFYVVAVVGKDIVATYAPTVWYKCCENQDKVPRSYNPKTDCNKVFFEGVQVELPVKIKNTIGKLVEQQFGNQNPVFYLDI